MKQVQRKENDGVHQNSSPKDCGRMDQVISLEIQERGEKMLETVDETIEKTVWICTGRTGKRFDGE